ncbi:hypothetical protein A9Q74_07080 [Colwellia sp. 39_35_sub15_T18]|nr:hypothetical protein A9Q74_07080 [Colwellia sp. 39_35_sub15_T18]
MSSYLEIQLAQQPIELCKLLKVANLVGGGGEAKVVISEGYVLLNGEVEFQKRKKIYHNDVVEFNGEVIQVIINEALAEQISEPTVNSEQAAASTKISSSKQATNVNIGSNNKEPRKRKPISF